jgi:PAS domain S-box-containing protein
MKHGKQPFVVGGRVALTVAFAGFAAMLCAALTVLHAAVLTDQVREQIRTRLHDAVALGAQRIEVELHDALTRPEQEGSATYRRVRDTLRQAQQAATGIHYAYTMREGPGGSIVFVVDATTNAAEVAHLGDVYDDAGDLLRTRFAKIDQPLVEHETYTDRWGAWLSGYAPFYAADGRRAGVLGMDIKADDITAARRQVWLMASGLFVAVLPLCLVCGWFLAGRLATPVQRLAAEARTLIEWGSRSRRGESLVTELAILGTALRTLRDVLNGIRDVVVATDLNGGILYINDAGCAALGRSRKELLGQNVLTFGEDVGRGASQAEIMQRTRESGFWEGDVVNRAADGRAIVFETRTRLLFDGSEHPIGMVGISTDVSVRREAEQERRNLESRLQQAQKLESIETLAGGVAHEINNPIMGIMNYAQLILDKLGPEHEVAEFAKEIGYETERVAVIVRNLLAFARQEQQTYSFVRLCDIVEATLSLVRAVLRRDHILLHSDVPEDLPRIRCRSRQIQQVIMNLVSNARDALNQKYPGRHVNKQIIITGVVMADPSAVAQAKTDCRLPLEGAEQAAHEAESKIENRKSKVRLSVEDHGTGIASEVRERMYEPFYSTKPRDKGTGLGLSISYGIVTEHGGALTVETEPGEWTRFLVDLPAEDCGAPQQFALWPQTA